MNSPDTFKELIDLIIRILNPVAGLVIATGIFIFFWGLVKFIWQSGSEDAVKQGKKLMTWGVVALFVMFSVWGIVGILTNSFGWDIGAPFLRTTGPFSQPNESRYTEGQNPHREESHDFGGEYTDPSLDPVEEDDEYIYQNQPDVIPIQ